MSLEENIRRIADALELIANREAPTVTSVSPTDAEAFAAVDDIQT